MPLDSNSSWSVQYISRIIFLSGTKRIFYCLFASTCVSCCFLQKKKTLPKQNLFHNISCQKIFDVALMVWVATMVPADSLLLTISNIFANLCSCLMCITHGSLFTRVTVVTVHTAVRYWQYSRAFRATTESHNFIMRTSRSACYCSSVPDGMRVRMGLCKSQAMPCPVSWRSGGHGM